MRILRILSKIHLLKHLLITLLAVAVMGLFALVAMFAKPLDPIKRAISAFSFTDIYYEILNESGDPEPCHFITIVDLTKLTDRSDIAQTLEDIESCNPKVVGLDCVFDNEGENFDGNMAVMDVAEKYKNIVFAVKLLDWKNDSLGHTTIIHSFFQEDIPITEGTVNVPRTMYDSMKRTAPTGELYNGKWMPSIMAQVSNAYAERDVTYGKRDDVSINFSPTMFVKLQPEDVKMHPELIKDRIVLFGCLYEDSDFHWTPAGKIAGIELLAYSIQTLVLSKQVREIPMFWFCIASFLLVLIAQIFQSKYLDFMTSSSNLFVKFVLGSTYILNIVTFLFTSLFIGASFIIFRLYNISFNVAWSISVIAFLTMSRYMYVALSDYVKALAERHPKIKKITV